MRCFGQQKTLRSVWLRRARFRSELSISLSGEIAPMGQPRTIDRRKAGRQFDEHFVSAVHRLTHVGSQTQSFARARDIRQRARNVNLGNEDRLRALFKQ